MWEFTVFINVKVESLNEFSKDKPEIEITLDKNIKETTKIKMDKKYLQKSDLSITFSENSNLFINIFFGLAFEIISLIENLNNETSFRSLRPELVEKKDPPIIINTKKINDKCVGVFFNDIPMLDTLLVIDKKIIEKS